MTILDSEFVNHILKTSKINLGIIYFFEHIAIIEFNEGVHIDINNASEIIEELNAFFGPSKPYGVIANRINSYSVKLLDAKLILYQAKNLCAYAVVGHNSASKMNAEIENMFCNATKINYDNIYEAISSVNSRVKETIIIPLN
ncbi:hypothetical protein ACFQ0I_09570 [Mariniflexile aquimaris]|uniref:Uncharacterized protein n=1 Tax=Mariniflexile aquimaris TaxID=881009 RepID=A0ABW3BTN1_9FLAO